ncbi:uncharacterized protein LOC144122686 [Amblyomma americanum]
MIHAGGSSYAQRSVALSSAATSTQHQSNHQKRCCNFGKRQGPTYDSPLFLMPCRVFEETSSRRALFIQRLSSNVDGNRSKNIQGVRRSLLPSEYWALLLSLKPQPCLVPRYHSCSAKAVVWPFVAEQQQPVIVAERERKIRDSPLYAAAAGSSKVEGHRVHGRRRSSYPRVEKVQSGQLPHKIPPTADPSTRRPGEKNLRSHRNLTRPPEQPGCRPVLHLESKARNLPPARPHLGEVHADLAAPAALRERRRGGSLGDLGAPILCRPACTSYPQERRRRGGPYKLSAVLLYCLASTGYPKERRRGGGPDKMDAPLICCSASTGYSQERRRGGGADKMGAPLFCCPASTGFPQERRRGDGPDKMGSPLHCCSACTGYPQERRRGGGADKMGALLICCPASTGYPQERRRGGGADKMGPRLFIFPRLLATQRSGDEEAAPASWAPGSSVFPRPLVT